MWLHSCCCKIRKTHECVFQVSVGVVKCNLEMIYGEEERNRWFILIWRTKHEGGDQDRWMDGWMDECSSTQAAAATPVCHSSEVDFCLIYIGIKLINPAGICFHLASDVSDAGDNRPSNPSYPSSERLAETWNCSCKHLSKTEKKMNPN